MKLNNQKYTACPQAFRAAIFLVAGLFVIAAVPQARGQNWTRNQKLYCGHSPAGASIARNYDTSTSCGTSVCPGQLVHIVHGVEASVNNSNSVMVKIGLPPAFTVIPNGIQVVNFPNGATTGTTSTPPSTLSTAFSVGALNCPSVGHADKVIIVIDGYFTQAGAYSATFDITDTATQPKTDPQVSLNGDSKCTNPQFDIAITKEVKDSSGTTWGSSATFSFGSTVHYMLKVSNLSTSDLYLGPQLLTVYDTLSVPITNGVDLGLTVTPVSCTAVTGTDCVSMPSASTATLRRNHTDSTTLTFNYSGSGFLPHGGSFVILFDVLINTPSTCYTTQTYELDNVASISYANTIRDQNPSNDQSSPTVVTLNPLPAAASTPCPPTTPIPALTVKKTLIFPVTAPLPSPVPAQPWGPFTYEIDITNNTSGPVSGLQLQDDLNGSIGMSPFTADFVVSASNPTCNPACTGTLPVTNKPIVGSWPILFKAEFAQLASGKTQTVVYTVTYDAPCTEASPGPSPTNGGTITNRAILIAGATGNDSVDVPMVPLPLCDLQVTKTQTAGPTSFASYTTSGQTLKYHVQWKNNSNKTITVGSIVDAMSIDSALYGDVPVDYSYGGATGGSQCTVNNVTMPSGAVLSQPVTSVLIPYKLYSWSGIRAIDFSGAIFGPSGTIDCDLSATLKQPSMTDSLCQGEVAGRAPPHFINEAFMDLIPPNYYLGYYTSYLASYPTWHKEVVTQLPYCISISVGKTAPTSAYPGAPVTFTVTVTNQGKDPISNVAVSDVLPTALTGPFSWNCTTNCGSISPTSGSTKNINPTINNLPAGATVTILVTATVPADTETGKSICNHVQASPAPFPANTYFEGDHPDLLEIGDACIQVIPNVDVTPSPTPTASPVESVSPTPTLTPSGCSEVSGEAHCLPNGGYSYTFNVKNNSGSSASQILLTPAQGSSFTLSPQLTNLSSPLKNGQSTTVTTTIGNIKPGDKPCFFVSLMSDQAPCCIVQVCPTLPPCGGFSPTPTPTATAAATATATGSLSPATARKLRPPPPSRRGKRRP
ncbi:MAG: DUF11 domain-containing protein [Candidatus Udaeobacter sp.]